MLCNSCDKLFGEFFGHKENLLFIKDVIQLSNKCYATFNNLIVMQISAVLAIKTSTNNRRPYDFTQVLKFTSNNCIL